MSRYIDVDELIRKIDEHECYSYDPEVSRICELINDAPTLDVEPVRHGRWEDKTQEIGWPVAECPVCGSHAGMFWMNYCPNCGAKMDEEEQENGDIEER